jgi:hypothetical protein
MNDLEIKMVIEREKLQKIRDKAIKRLKELQDGYGIEEAHMEADNILCEVLEAMGLFVIVEEYAKIDKWYA